MVVNDEAIETTADRLVFPARTRWALSGGAVVVGVALVGFSVMVLPGLIPNQEDRYLMAHALGAAPFLAGGLACSWRTLTVSSPGYQIFWRRWLAAQVTGTVATVAAIAAVITQQRAFVALDMVMLAVGVPLWSSAVLHAVRAQAGRWSLSVDVVDAATAVIVLGAPGVLVLAEPLAETERLGYAVPFVLMAILTPAVLYLSFLNLSRIRRGERAAQGIGVALAGALGVNITLQLAYVVADLAVPLGVVVGVHVLNMGLLMGVAVWSRRSFAQPQPRDDVARQSPMPYVSALVLPAVGVYVFVGDRSWEVAFFGVVLLVVVALNALRYTAMRRETHRLSADLARVSEERRRLLAGMLRGIDDERRRTAAALHSQTLGALAVLGGLVQTARLTLAAETASQVADAVARLQGDVCDRAEELRQLIVAMKHPASEPVSGTDGERADHVALAAALQAFVAELYRERTAPEVRVEIDPELQLDWSTEAIAHRIAQEALRSVARRQDVAEVEVSLREEGGTVVLEVGDDGRDVSPAPRRDPGVAMMEMFAQIGRGDVVELPRAEGGRTVRSRLGLVSGQGDRHNGSDEHDSFGRDRLHLITNADVDA